MDDKPYEELTYFPIVSVKNGKEQHVAEGERAVQLAHGREINQVKESLEHYHSVLVVCDKILTSPILRVLRALWKDIGIQLKEVACNKVMGASRPGENSMAQLQSSVTGQLTHQLARVLKEAFQEERTIVVIRHLDLMTWTAAGQPRHELNDVIYWISEFRDVVNLAFWDPVYTVPKIIEDLFPTIVSFRIFGRECMWKIVGTEEAKKISPSVKEFTLPAQLMLYQYLSGTNMVEVRRILRGLTRFSDCIPGNPGSARKAFEHIRNSVSPGKIQPLLEGGEIAGYSTLREKMEREVLFPILLRYKSKSEKELNQADTLIPKGIILYGPPGTGKTEWVKWLASKLGFMLLIINGPELKSKYVGETEAAIRSVFSQARRTAPALILIDELDSLTPSRDSNQANYDSSMVAQFLTEMDGLHKDEAVLVVGTTNRLEAVDDAFKRPGRFEVQVEVGYPDKEDRKHILCYYNQKLELGLTETAIGILAQETEGALDPESEKAKQQYHDAYKSQVITDSYYDKAGPMLHRELKDRFGLNQITRFSGDHLRAICRYLLRESLYRKDKNQNGKDQDNKNKDRKNQEPGLDVNDPDILKKAVDAVRSKVRSDKRSAEITLSSPGTGHSFYPDTRF